MARKGKVQEEGKVQVSRRDEMGVQARQEAPPPPLGPQTFYATT